MIGNNVDKTQHKLFSTLEELLNPKHPLFALANRIDWREFDSYFKDYYSIVCCVTRMLLNCMKKY
ncbi:MAG: hypothetical protein LBI42_09815 [Chitinispirillales bacterium]|jgi:hypothetical protein|nr:hypothetical protein [Chitinispirillales bacterium]